MKQSEIKVGRYYTGFNQNHVRFVTSISKGPRRNVLTWWPEGTGENVAHRFHKTQQLKSFARWAYGEVKPVYNQVIRCPNCDAWKWESDISADAECERCGTPCNMWKC